MKKFESNTISIHGKKGEEWLQSLPQITADISMRLGLQNLQPAPNLSYNYVASGMQGERPVILKLGLDVKYLQRETETLLVFQNHGAAKVLLHEPGIILLERAMPGTSLKSYYPDRELESLQIACQMMKKLHEATISQHHNFPHMRDWLAALDKEWDIPDHYLIKARELRDKISHINSPEVFLHGDLHHDNILQNGDDWIVIDPKGVIGAPIYEIWAFLNNPEPIEKSVLLNRIEYFSKELEYPVQLIIDCCFVQSILSWTWDLEDGVPTHTEWIASELYSLLELS